MVDPDRGVVPASEPHTQEGGVIVLLIVIVIVVVKDGGMGGATEATGGRAGANAQGGLGDDQVREGGG